MAEQAKYCALCGNEPESWMTDDLLWVSVVGEPNRKQTLCMACFIDEGEKAGIYLHWTCEVDEDHNPFEGII